MTPLDWGVSIYIYLYLSMTYIPNILDPRTNKRIRIALGFIVGVMSPTTPHQWSTRYIDKHLSRQNTSLGRWLRDKLLITSSHRYNKDTGECKSYVMNEEGVRYVKGLLSGTNPHYTTPTVQQLQLTDYSLVSECAKWAYKDEMLTYKFIYNDKSNRLWHPLQNIKREYKQTLFNDIGLSYQYDVECCAPTLIHQFAMKCGMDLYLFALRKYLLDRAKIRQEIAIFVGISEKQAKDIVNALFAGARIGVGNDYAIGRMLTSTQVSKLKEMKYITELRSDIKVCWDHIIPHVGYKTKVINNKERRIPMSSRQKWNIYFDLERQILNAVNAYLITTNNNCFLEHDGWSCMQEISERDVQEHVKSVSGYDIQVKRTNPHYTTPTVQQLQFTDYSLVKGLQEISERDVKEC